MEEKHGGVIAGISDLFDFSTLLVHEPQSPPDNGNVSRRQGVALYACTHTKHTHTASHDFPCPTSPPPPLQASSFNFLQDIPMRYRQAANPN